MRSWLRDFLEWVDMSPLALGGFMAIMAMFLVGLHELLDAREKDRRARALWDPTFCKFCRRDHGGHACTQDWDE
jgi:hypothetical protein